MLSIITINYNNRSGLERTMQSVVEQTCQDYEWVIIDGGSTDGSVDVINKYSDHITSWVSEPDKGIYNALNKGVSNAHGKYLIFLNSGDYFENKNIVNDFKNLKVTEEIVYGDVKVVSDGDVKFEIVFPESINLEFFLQYNLCQQSMFYPKRCFIDNLFTEDYKISSDREFNTRLMIEGYSFRKWDRFVACFDYNGVSSSNESKRKAEDIKALSSVVPIETLIKEYIDLHERYNTLENEYKSLQYMSSNDISKKAIDIVSSSKFYRYLLRFFLYPIHWLSTKTTKHQRL